MQKLGQCYKEEAIMKKKEEVVRECPYMGLPKCFRQDISNPLDTQVCIACILSRIEQHLFKSNKK